MEEEKAPLMDEMMMQEEPELEDEDSFVDDSSAKDCCYCQCCPGACYRCRKESKGRIFCCCCPLSCGVATIAQLTVFIVIYLTIDSIFIFFNEYVDPIYPFVILVLTIPLWVAACMYECNFRSKNKGRRGLLKWSILITIIVLVLLGAWAVYYFTKIYKYNDFYQGTGDKDDRYNYSRTPKTTFIVFLVFIVVVFIVLYAYFWCVSESWAELGDESEESRNQETRGALDWGFRARDDSRDEKPKKKKKDPDANMGM